MGKILTTMPTETGSEAAGSAIGGNGGTNSYLPYHLIPQFKPGETDINDYSRRLQFLAELWPKEQLGQLAPRAAMMCEGTAFQKAIRIDPSKLKSNDTSGVKLLVQTLGGIWGRSTTETKYERFEKAIFGTIQKSDESNESYVARHEVQYEDLLSMGLTLEELRAYVLLRNSCLSADDKKRIIIDSAGTLDYKKVTSSLQLLGSRFFGELQSGHAKTGQKTKSYDINHVYDEVDPEHSGEVDETVFLSTSQETADEAAIDHLLQEGDEDALIVQQFEDSILDCLQSDQEVAACYNIYVDARKRVLDRAKGRGFWTPPPKGGKDKGRGKSKSKSFRRRPPLEQRIANSACRICGRQGHWKAECPFKNRPPTSSTSSTNPSTAGAFAGVASVSNPGIWDVIGEEDGEPPSHATFYVAEESCFTSWVQPKVSSFYGESQHKGNHLEIVRRLLSMPSRRKPIRTPLMMKSPHRDPLPKVRDINQGFVKSEEGANVVTSGSFGIVDLGASMSVIGEISWKILFKQMPTTVQNQIRQAPCTVSFRFGNDSVVQGNQAVYIPIGKYWLKLIIVPSNTPFLIANSVFRKLGAVIDTESNQIHFRKLGCSLRITLSERKLYLLDLLDLILQANRQNVSAAETVKTSDILQCSVINQEQSCDPIPLEVSASPDSHTGKSPGTWPIANVNSVRPKDILHDQPCETNQTVVESHVVHQPGQSFPSSNGGSPGSGRDRQLSPDELCGAGQRNHHLRDCQEGNPLQRSHQRRPLHNMVLRDVPQQLQTEPSQISALCEAPCRGVGEDASHSSQECSQTIDQREGSSALHATTVGVIRGRRDLGQVECPQPGGGGTTTTDVEDGECHGTDPCSPERSEAEPGPSLTSEPSVVDPCVQTDLWEQIQQIMIQEKPSEVFDNHHEEIHLAYSKNWVAEEMWEYMSSKGFIQDPKKYQQIKSLLLEVYCSPNSELTNQAQQQGSAATRFGLRDGNLATREGRLRLYDRLTQVLPRDIWMSPSCRAWCRWNIFNMSRSIESARKVIEARESEAVHLLLCDALFQFQLWRSPQCHAHLEQPQGSQMIHREELSTALAHTNTALCDMCVAGQLRNPETGEFMKKGTQILTTSAILYRALGQLKCNREHHHCPIAGSYKDKAGKRQPLAQFTELYTRVFARKTIRMMQCSAQVCETHGQNLVHRNALHEAHTIEETGDTKRRRVGDKQPPPPSYVALYRQQAIEKLIKIANDLAPKVGKRQFLSGDLIQQLSEMFPEHHICGAEVCKGADRRRVPFSGITKQEAPLRLTIGTHRNESGHFSDETWEDWTCLTRKNLIRNCHPSRMLITVFARSKALEPSSSVAVGTAGNTNPELVSRDRLKRNSVVEESIEEGRDPKKSRLDETDESRELPPEGTLPVAEHGPRFAKLPEETRREITKIHKNLGHPDNKLLQRVLKDQNWEPNIVDSIVDFHCPACFETQRPKLARPGHLSEPREFNDLVLIDGVKWTNKTGKQFYFVHMLDAGTNFQIAFLADDRSSKSMIEAIRHRWFAWAGPPRHLMSDSAGEFCSEEFGQFLQTHNCRSIVIPAEAHWQLGRCERHGSILQHMLEKYEIDLPIDDDHMMSEALIQCTNAKNSLSRYRGYSPEILVLGKATQIPGSNSSEDPDSAFWDPDENLDHEGEGTVFQKNLHRREVARQAFISADHSHKIRRAILRRSRPSRDNFHRGQWVMYWRNGQGQQKGGWNGPAKVLMVEDKNVIWVTHSSRLYRCAPEHLRMLSSREATDTIGREQWEIPLTTGTGVFQFTDLSHQTFSDPVAVTTSNDSPNVHQAALPENAAEDPLTHPPTHTGGTIRWREYPTFSWSARCRTRGGVSTKS